MPPSGTQSQMNRRDALMLWHQVTLESVQEAEPDLSTRQLAILTTIYLERGPHTVKSLASQLNVTKAVVTRALDTLGRYKFIIRRADPRDRRSVIIERTGPGSVYLTNFADRVRACSMPRVNVAHRAA